MANFLHLLLTLVVGCSPVLAQTDCNPDSSYCKCTTSDGSLTIDLRHIGLSYPAPYEDTKDNYFYYYAPCDAQQCGTGEGGPSTVCQEAINAEGTKISVARYSNFKWTITNADLNNLMFEIMYGGGDEAKEIERSAVIRFSKGTSNTVFTFDNEDNDQLIYNFNVVGKGVAPYSGSSGGKGGGSDDIAGPIGLVLIFLSLGALIAYFVVGGIYMYYRKGARGVEVIPNYVFWKGLPFLIKDGFFFIISPCYKGKYQSL